MWISVWDLKNKVVYILYMNVSFLLQEHKNTPYVQCHYCLTVKSINATSTSTFSQRLFSHVQVLYLVRFFMCYYYFVLLSGWYPTPLYLPPSTSCAAFRLVCFLKQEFTMSDKLKPFVQDYPEGSKPHTSCVLAEAFNLWWDWWCASSLSEWEITWSLQVCPKVLWSHVLPKD